jgi:hypothetical protein
MILNKRVCVCIPAGRKRYLEILVDYLLQELSIIDEIRIWVNTTNSDDLKYIESLPRLNEVFTLDYSASSDPQIGSSTAISLFFRNCCDDNTIYLRLDDDIVFLEKDYVKETIICRLNNPDYFLILGNIINNAVCDFNHKLNGALDTSMQFYESATCPIGWGNEELTLQKHQSFFENWKKKQLDLYKFKNKVWSSRFSINSICWNGSDFNKFGGMVEYGNEENWLTHDRNNLIFGEKICCHYSFWITRDYLSKTDVLERYKTLCQKKIVNNTKFLYSY